MALKEIVGHGEKLAYIDGLKFLPRLIPPITGRNPGIGKKQLITVPFEVALIKGDFVT